MELMEWVPGKEGGVARYKDPARNGHEITFVTKERLLQAVGHVLESTHFTSATEPERVGASDTNLLIMLGRTRRGGSNELNARRRVASNVPIRDAYLASA
jgi:hypothetical protein